MHTQWIDRAFPSPNLNPNFPASNTPSSAFFPRTVNPSQVVFLRKHIHLPSARTPPKSIEILTTIQIHNTVPSMNPLKRPRAVAPFSSSKLFRLTRKNEGERVCRGESTKLIED